MNKSSFLKTNYFYLIAFVFVLLISFFTNNYTYLFQDSNNFSDYLDSIKSETLAINLTADSIRAQETNSSLKEINKKYKNPNTNIESSLPDFKSNKSVKLKKRAFFDFLKPYVFYENNLILKQRAYINEKYGLLMTQDSLNTEDIALLNKYVQDYRCINTDLSNPETLKELLVHVDIIPQELVLVQAALESSWGNSYFAKVANNLFGQWCFTPGCGIVPRARKKGDTHEVEKFKTINLSVRSYMLFLNSHPAFDELRKERAINRLHKEKPSALRMADGLMEYSAKGKAYIRDVKSMIRSNKKLITEPLKFDDTQVIALQKQDSLQKSN